MLDQLVSAVESGELRALDLGVWSYLSWRSDRQGIYTKSRVATAEALGLSVGDLKSSVKRLQQAGAVKNLSPRGSRRIQWAIMPKHKTASTKNRKGSTKNRKGSTKPDTVEETDSGLPF